MMPRLVCGVETVCFPQEASSLERVAQEVATQLKEECCLGHLATVGGGEARPFLSKIMAISCLATIAAIGYIVFKAFHLLAKVNDSSRESSTEKEVCLRSSQQPPIPHFSPAESNPPANCLYRSLDKHPPLEGSKRERKLLEKLKEVLSQLPERNRLVSVDSLPQLWNHVKKKHLEIEGLAAKKKLFVKAKLLLLPQTLRLASDQPGPLAMPTYWKVAKLGVGEFKKVWLIVDLCHKKILCLAVTKLSPLADLTLLPFQQEQQAYNLLAGAKNILPVYGIYYWVHKEERYQGIVSKYFPGDLFDLIFQKKLSSRQKWKIALEVAIGVHSCHANNLLHRDIKLENILVRISPLTDGLEVSVIDFGLSEREDQPHHFSGSLLYIAPELLFISIQDQEKGKKNLKTALTNQWVDRYGRCQAQEGAQLANKTCSSLAQAGISRKTDIYALGLVFWALFRSKLPDYTRNYLCGYNPYEVIAHQHKEIEQLKVDQASGRLLKAICATLPDERPTIEEIIAQLQQNKEELIQEMEPLSLVPKAIESASISL